MATPRRARRTPSRLLLRMASPAARQDMLWQTGALFAKLRARASTEKTGGRVAIAAPLGARLCNKT